MTSDAFDRTPDAETSPEVAGIASALDRLAARDAGAMPPGLERRVALAAAEAARATPRLRLVGEGARAGRRSAVAAAPYRLPIAAGLLLAGGLVAAWVASSAGLGGSSLTGQRVAARAASSLAADVELLLAADSAFESDPARLAADVELLSADADLAAERLSRDPAGRLLDEGAM